MAIEAGMDSAALRLGAYARCRERRNASGAPGAIDISTMPISASRGARVTASAMAGAATSTAKSPRAMGAAPRRAKLAQRDAEAEAEHHREQRSATAAATTLSDGARQ